MSSYPYLQEIVDFMKKEKSYHFFLKRTEYVSPLVSAHYSKARCEEVIKFLQSENILRERIHFESNTLISEDKKFESKNEVWLIRKY